MSGYDDILQFWFGNRPIATAEAFKERAPLWFGASAENDALVTRLHGDTIERVARGEHADWADHPRGRLALILAVDQFPRNVYRGTARAYAYDAKALELSEEGIARGLDRDLPVIQRLFFNMPRGHAESVHLQQVANAYVEELFVQAPALSPLVMPHARQHLAVIARFGRFPERNAALGRVSTPEEQAYLQTGAL
jgi:uncharacterized protein (DUF924 family)